MSQRQSATANDIDAGLDRLVATAAPGETFTQTQIAEACGCSKTLIWLLEKSAKRKLRVELERRGFGSQPAPVQGKQRPHRCHGRLIKNEASNSSSFTEAYVCSWCGATFDAMTDISLGQRCTRSYAPSAGDTLGDLMSSSSRGRRRLRGGR